MKKNRLIIILLILFTILIILLKNDIIILPFGYIDGIKYSTYQIIEQKTPLMASSKPWEELTIAEQNYEIKTFNNTVYKSCNIKPISSLIINEKIDEWLDNKGMKIADIYSIKEISKDVAIALKFNNSIEFYTYINQVCPETTLEEFVTKYNIIEDDFNFTSIDYINKKNNKKLVLENKNFETSEIQKIIFDSLKLPLTNFYEEIDFPYISVETNSNIYGNGIIFYLTKDNKLIIEIQSIQKSLQCELDKNYFDKIFRRFSKKVRYSFKNIHINFYKKIKSSRNTGFY